MKRLYIGLLSAVLMCLALPAALAAAEQVTLEFWFEAGDEASKNAMAETVKDFQAEYPHIVINVSNLGNVTTWEDRFISTIAGGTPPDTAWAGCGSTHEMRASGLLLPLNEYLERIDPSVVPLDVWTEPAITECSYRGIWYGLPVRLDIRGLFTNTDLLEASGIGAREGPKTIDELDAMAQKLTRLDGNGNPTQLGFSPYGVNLPEPYWFHAFGGSFFDWERLRVTFTGSPANQRAMEWWASYADSYGLNARAAANAFHNGTLAIYIGSTGNYQRFLDEVPDLNFWAHTLPYQPGGRNPNMSAVQGPVIPIGAPHPEEAATFLAFLARPEVQVKYFLLTNEMPARIDALKEIGPYLEDPRNAIVIGQWAETTGRVPLWRTFIQPLRNDWLPRVWAKELSPAAMLEQYEQLVNAEYAQVFPLE